MLRNLTLDYMNRVFIGTEKSGVHASVDAELLLQGLRVSFHQGVASTGFIDVNLLILQVFGGTKETLALISPWLKLSNSDRLIPTLP